MIVRLGRSAVESLGRGGACVSADYDVNDDGDCVGE